MNDTDYKKHAIIFNLLPVSDSTEFYRCPKCLHNVIIGFRKGIKGLTSDSLTLNHRYLSKYGICFSCSKKYVEKKIERSRL